MSEDIVNVIMASLARIEAKLDAHGIDISNNGQRLAVLEAKMIQQEKVNEQVAQLMSVRDQGIGIKAVVGWLITTAIAIGSYFKQ